MVLVVPICAVLAFAQVIYLAMNPVDPLVMGGSSLAALATLGLSASALIAHRVQSTIDHIRRPLGNDFFNIFSNSFYTNANRVSSCFFAMNNSVQSYRTTTPIINPQPTIQPYVFQSATNFSSAEAPVELKFNSSTSSRGNVSPSRTPRQHKLHICSSCAFSYLSHDNSTLLEHRPMRLPSPETTKCNQTKRWHPDSLIELNWLIGILALFITLLSGICIGIMVERSRKGPTKREIRPQPPTCLPAYWTAPTADELAYLNAVKYHPILSMAGAVMGQPVHNGARTMDFRPKEIEDTFLLAHNLVTTQINVLSSRDTLSLKDKSEGGLTLTCDAEPYSTIGHRVAPRSVVLHEGNCVGARPLDKPAPGEASPPSERLGDDLRCPSLSYGMELGSTTSICSVIDGSSFNLGRDSLDVPDRSGGVVDPEDSDDYEANPWPSGGIDDLAFRQASRQRAGSQEERENLAIELTLIPSIHGARSVPRVANSVDECSIISGCELGKATNQADMQTDGFDEDVKPATNPYPNISASDPNGSSIDCHLAGTPTQDTVVEGYIQSMRHKSPFPSPSLISNSAVTSLPARDSRLDEIPEFQKETLADRPQPPEISIGHNFNTCMLPHIEFDQNVWLLDEDTSMDSGLGLVSVESLLDIMEGKETGGEWLLGITIGELSRDWTFSVDEMPTMP